MKTDGKYYRWSDSATRTGGTFGPTGQNAVGEFGLLPVNPYTPFRLGIIADGEAMCGQAAFNKLKADNFTLPEVPEDPPETIWQYTNPYITGELPAVPKGDILCPFGYELIQYSSGMIVQRASLEMAIMLLNGNIVDAWRVYNPASRDSETIIVANPDYEAGHAAYLAAVDAYHQAVNDKFTVQFCTYYFPTLKLGSTVRWYRKDEPEGVWPVGRWLASHEIPVDPSHPLAGNGRKKGFFIEARPEDYKDFTTIINQSISEAGNDDRLKHLLALK